MPLKLFAPKAGRSPYWRIRGTYLGCYRNRSTGTSEKRIAQQALNTIKREIERDINAEPQQPGFSAAAAAYMKAGGNTMYLEPLIAHFKTTPINDIDQIVIDGAAVALYPRAAASTLNRQVYTPVSAVLKRAGIEKKIKRPKGWRGDKSTSWLEPDQAFSLFAAADDIEAEFGLFLRTLLYTGMRLSEALNVRLQHLNMHEAMIYLPRTKNSEPRAVHLPPVLIAALASQPPRKAVQHSVKGRRWQKGEGGKSPANAGVAFLERPSDTKLFRYHAGGHLRDMLALAMKNANLSFPPRQRGFHLMCHTYGTWMHRYGNLDNFGLTRTSRWKDPKSAERYLHTAVNEEARRADLLPTRAKSV